MVEVIRPKFDVTRGWPNISAYDKTFAKVVDDAASTGPLKVREGTVVAINPQGDVYPATVLLDGGAFKLYMVIEGNDPLDSYAGDYLDKVVGIAGDFEVVLSTTMFVAGAYAPGDQISILGGKVKIADGSNVAVPGCFVVSYDSVSDLLKVAFNL